MIEDASRNAVIGQVVLILSGLLGGFLGFLISLFGLGAYALGMSGFADVFGDSRIFRFVVFSIIFALAGGAVILGGFPRFGLLLLAIGSVFDVLANYYLYEASGVPAIIWGYGLMLLGIPLLLIYIGILFIVIGRVMVIYGYHAIPEVYRIRKKARNHVGLG
ncbi:hypothetical protein [Thermococcus sp. MV11]|uniref:hypothetical protein n=1 Tax=Thermococcus sp. MV11 TaxID=1638267 RepID=UPI0014306FF8|nr:hypothetical protein [Thermococcus sp. MV11]NJE04341.1 hypothetical protein [Thermococcus sp. MV11]